jgi:DNA-binding Lrp family transcriptional regulator
VAALPSTLVAQLQADARLTNRTLADRVGVAPSTALERVRALRRRGVLRGFHADVDLNALGRSVQALIAVRIRPPARERIEAFRDFASRLPETLDVFVVTGPEDFLIHVGVPDTDALYALSSTGSPDAPRSPMCEPRSFSSICVGASLSRSR